MPQFDIATFPGQALWILIAFFAQYFIMVKLILPGFKAIFSKRIEHIERHLKRAENFSKKAENLRSEYEQKLEVTKKNHDTLISTAKNEINRNSDATLSQLEKAFLKELQLHEATAKKLHVSMEKVIDDTAINLAINMLNKLTPSTRIDKKKLIKYLN